MKRYLLLLLLCCTLSPAQNKISVDASQIDGSSYSVPLQDGNYKVTITFGSKKTASNTTVYAESRRLLASNITTKKKEFKTMSWTIHKRSPKIYKDGTPVDSVRYKAREKDYLNWDANLTLIFCGSSPAISNITIEPDTTAQTLFLCGNSTVVDQEHEPWASWGQMITSWFDDNICIANYAESGETTSSFLYSRRLDKALSMAKPGDLFLIEFGHNDEKDHAPGSGAWYNFSHNLKIFIDRLHNSGCEAILITPTARRLFANGTLKDTHGQYPDAVRATAQRENLGLIDLTSMTTTLFNAYGEEDSKHFLVHYPANSYPNQDKPLADNTHFNDFGAYQVSKCIILGLQNLASQADSPASNCASHIVNWQSFDPSHPDDWQTFNVPPVTSYEIAKPDGN